MDDELDEILLFQSGPMSSNMLADWQIKHAKAAIIAWADKRAEQQVREARVDELEKLGNYKDQYDDRYDLYDTVKARIAALTNKEQK